MECTTAGALSLLKTGLLYGCCELPETVSRLSAYLKESNHEQNHLARWPHRHHLVSLGILRPTLKAPAAVSFTLGRLHKKRSGCVHRLRRPTRQSDDLSPYGQSTFESQSQAVSSRCSGEGMEFALTVSPWKSAWFRCHAELVCPSTSKHQKGYPGFGQPSWANSVGRNRPLSAISSR